MPFDVKFNSTNQRLDAQFKSLQVVGTGSGGGGEDGKDGKSAYEIAVLHGYKGSESEWLDSLHGEDGQPGEDGYTPIKGVDYFDGKDGEDGEDGKSAYQYALDGGYTGTEAEFAAKLAAENPDLSNYYTKEETNDLIDTTYEVIDNIVLEEAVSTVVRYYPQGYKKLQLSMEVPAAESNFIGICMANGAAMGYVGTMRATTQKQTHVEYVVDNGLIFMDHYGNANTADSSLMYAGSITPYPRAIYGYSGEKITSIEFRMLSNGILPPGTTIRVRGVMADA